MMSIGSYLKANMGASFTQVREVEKKGLQLPALSRTDTIVWMILHVAFHLRKISALERVD